MALENEQKAAKPPPMTLGEKVFDVLAYGGIAGVANFVISIFSGYSSRYGRMANFTRKVEEQITKTGINEAAAKDVTMTTALFMGGMATIPFVKVMEDHKQEFVGSVNQAVGCTQDSDHLKTQPKQSWSSLLKSRAYAWLVVFGSLRGAASVFGAEKFERFENWFAKELVCNPLNKPTHINGMETKAFKYGRIAAIDLFATTAASSLLYYFSRMFAKQEHDAEKSASVQGNLHMHHGQPHLHLGQEALGENEKSKQSQFVERLKAEAPRTAIEMH